MNRLKGSRLLLTLALALLLTGFAGSIVYWSAQGNAAFLATQENYGAAIAAAATNKDAAQAAADVQWRRVQQVARAVEAHGHLLFLCVLLVLFSVLLAGTSVTKRRRGLLAWSAVAGVLMYPAGLIVQATGLVLVGQALAAAGSVLLLLAVSGIVTGLLRPQDTGPPPGGGRPT